MIKIEPKYVTFKQAKWLKEKGWNQTVKSFWKNPNGIPSLHIGVLYYNNRTKKDGTELPAYSAPEQWQVVEWFYQEHNIWITVDNLIDNKFYFSIRFTNTFDYASRKGCEENGFNSPEQAYRAAFDYILNNNLI